MAQTIKMYGNFPLLALKKLISDLSSESTIIKCCALTADYVFSQDNHTSYNDLTNEVAQGNGYITGGATVTGKTVTYSARVTTLDCLDVDWTNTGFSCRYFPFYDSTPSGNTNKKLILCVDAGETVSPQGLTINLAGLFSFTVAA